MRQGLPVSGTRQGWGFLLTAAALTSLGLGGCCGFWEDVTSKDFQFQQLFVKPDPLVVLDKSDDGDKRAKALLALYEPKQHGGTNRQQDTVIEILVTAARTESRALCRLAAIESLGHFKDARAVQGIKDAYYVASAFPPESCTMIKCKAVTALGNTGSPEAIDLLVNAVSERPMGDTKGGLRDADQRQALDVRIAAARALGKFHDPRAAGALEQVLRTEKDVALRDGARESLQACTGKKLPPDEVVASGPFHLWPEHKPAVADGPAKDKPVQPAAYQQPGQEGAPVPRQTGRLTCLRRRRTVDSQARLDSGHLSPRSSSAFASGALP